MTVKFCACGTEIQPEQDECEECEQLDQCSCGRWKHSSDPACEVCAEDWEDARQDGRL